MFVVLFSLSNKYFWVAVLQIFLEVIRKKFCVNVAQVSDFYSLHPRKSSIERFTQKSCVIGESTFTCDPSTGVPLRNSCFVTCLALCSPVFSVIFLLFESVLMCLVLNSGKKEKCIQKLKVFPECSNAASLGLKDVNTAHPAENVSL